MDEGRGWENENEKKKMILKISVCLKLGTVPQYQPTLLYLSRFHLLESIEERTYLPKVT